MKPSRSTVETLTDHVLNFETSRRADRARSFRERLLYRLKGTAVGARTGESVMVLARMMVGYDPRRDDVPSPRRG